MQTESPEAEPPEADPPKRKRRWFQFSLRSLMVPVTLLAIACGYVGWQVRIVHERDAMAHHVVGDLRGVASTPAVRPDGSQTPSIPWIRRVIGDGPVDEVCIPLNTNLEERRRIAITFPEANVLGFHPPFNTDTQHDEWEKQLVPFPDADEVR